MVWAEQVVDRRFALNSTLLQSALTLLLIGLLSALSYGVRLFQVVTPQDEGILLVYPDLILRGYVPYRDFAAIYPPGNFYLLAGAFQLIGTNVIVERLIGVGYQFSMAAAVYFLGARFSWLTGFLGAAVLLAVLHFFPAAGAYSMFGALSATLWALFCAYQSSANEDTAQHRQWTVLAGFLACLVYWFRQDIGVVGTLAVCVTLRLRNVRQLTMFSLGFAWPSVAMIVFILLAGPVNVFDSLVLDVLRMIPGRTFPIELSLGFVALMACIAFNVVLALLLRPPKVSEHRVWLVRGIAALSVGLLPPILQQVGVWHFTYVGCAIAGLTVVSLHIALIHIDWHPGSHRFAAAALVTAVIGIFSAAFARNLSDSMPAAKLALEDRWVFEGKMYDGDVSSLADARGLLEELHQIARPGQKLFIGPDDLRFAIYNDTSFYFLLPDLQPVSRYLEMNPGSANRSGSGLADQVAGADWLILTSRYRNLIEPNDSRIPGSSLPNEVVGRLFCLHSKHGVWQLLQRCERRRAQ
jgi:hypothetical protein